MQRLINAARTLDSGALSVSLEDAELLRPCALIVGDLGLQAIVGEPAAEVASVAGYYAMPLEWFTQSVATAAGFPGVFVRMRAAEPDFPTYLKALCEIHKRRRKFQLILQRQALPQLAQLAPRCLLGYGLKPSEALASWLVWRNWLYDIDNRSAQETGYLFEQILAASLGGVPSRLRAMPHPYTVKLTPVRASSMGPPKARRASAR